MASSTTTFRTSAEADETKTMVARSRANSDRIRLLKSAVTGDR